MLPPAQTAPEFGGFLDIIVDFTVAWVGRYWWIVAILGILYYTRWYNVVVSARGVNIATPLVTLRLAMASLAERFTQSLFHVIAATMFFVSTLIWLLQSFGTLGAGTLGMEPVIWGNVAAILVSIGAGLGIEAITPRIAVAAFLGASVLAFAIGEAGRRAEELD